MPRKNSAAGREMLARIEALPRIVDISQALEVVGLNPQVPVLISDRCGHSATITGRTSLGVLFVGVPWRDIDSKELERYKDQREAGNSWSMGMEHLLWQPTAEMPELKRWEVKKEIEELNARRRAEQDGLRHEARKPPRHRFDLAAGHRRASVVFGVVGFVCALGIEALVQKTGHDGPYGGYRNRACDPIMAG